MVAWTTLQLMSVLRFLRALGEPRAVRLTAETALLGLGIGLAVVAPWTHGGYVLLLDWVSGPQQTLSTGVYGLSADSLGAMPFRLGTQALRVLFGPRTAAWLTILIFFPVA